MNGAPAADMDASLLNGYYPEWRLLIQRPCNVLFEGTVVDTHAVLRLLQPHLRAPIARHEPPAALDVPSGETRTLVLSDAVALSRSDQRKLLAWMHGKGSRTQIITTASRPLFPLVTAGLFDDTLYYRLNVLLLRVSAPLQLGLLDENGIDVASRPLPGSIAPRQE